MAYRDEDAELSLAQLTDEEALALLALAREIVALDGRVPDEERAALDDMAEELGPERYDALLERSNGLAGTDEELEQLVAAVERIGAREAIYGALFDLASAASMDPNELEVLYWLAETWGLEVRDLEGEGDEGEDDEDDDPGPDEDDEDEDEDDEGGEP